MNTNIDAYDWSSFDPEGFLTRLTRHLPAPAPAEGKIAPESVEQLYAVCEANDPDSELRPGLTVGDLYCGRGTKDRYTEMFTAHKLLEARSYTFDTTCGTIDLKVPYVEDVMEKPNFIARIFVNNPILFNDVRIRLTKTDKPIVIYAYWRKVGNELLATITSKSQFMIRED
ncbi:MAG: hypothetical protein IJH75_07775 [Mogibacterium sp.]|nr:hypothetical protein [Mogibacterium sp.]